MMEKNDYKELLNSFVQQSREILGDNLTGVYLHGSFAMGCFNPKKSDIDLLVVVKEDISNKVKRQYMDMIVEYNGQAPAKGIELSVVMEDVCNHFVYPTTYELHFSTAHLDWYKTDPEDYIERMKGTDRDLAAHFTITYHRGKTLYGKAIKEVFSEVSKEEYFDSILFDVENAKEEITDNPTYFILNLCRVLAYKEDNLILSKQEGGEWGLTSVPKQYTMLISDAMTEYSTNSAPQFDESLLKEYADYMLNKIK